MKIMFTLQYGVSSANQNGQNLYPTGDQNSSKTMHFGATHTYKSYVKGGGQKQTLTQI